MNEENAWLIGQFPKGGAPLWWDSFKWTHNLSEAVRFARKEDAEKVIRANQIRGAVATNTMSQPQRKSWWRKILEWWRKIRELLGMA